MTEDGDDRHDGTIPAGSVSAWVTGVLAALRDGADAGVPCGSCSACCTSSQFVLIGPDETDTLAHVPAELLFPAPRMPAGHVVLGYDERGHCPMLVDGLCSIYEHRPRTCRVYDCRVFPATGVEADGAHSSGIRRRAEQWRFDTDSDDDRARDDAMHHAARFLAAHAEVFPDGISAPPPTQLAALAVDVHELFLASRGADPDVAAVRAAVKAHVARRR